MSRARRFLVLSVTALLACALAAPPASHASGRLVARQGPHAAVTAGSGPLLFSHVGSLVYFSANDGTRGIEPWRTDGTPGGTRILTNVSPQEFSSYPTGFAGPGAAFFGAQDFEGHHLWKTNGTGPGTHILADVYATHLLTVGKVTYFAGETPGTSDTELWKTDGTPAGTKLVKDINPGGSSGPTRLHRVGKLVLFGADDGSHGFELWKTNGTRKGTRLVKDINTGGSALPFGDFWDDSVTTAGTTLFFTADDGKHGFELWKSNGTAAGTKLVRDLTHGSTSGSPDTFAALGNRVFFRGPVPEGTALWVSDGTPVGTHIVKRTSSSGTSQPEWMTAYKGAMYFVGFGGGSDFGTALFRTTGTAATTTKIKDIHAYGMAVAGTVLYLIGVDSAHGAELWRSNGTAAGTHLVKDIRQGPDSSSITGMTALGPRLIFSADDGKHGAEPWRSDGTPGGTILLRDVNPAKA
jgi:ELWxxDGT repeat protein